MSSTENILYCKDLYKSFSNDNNISMFDTIAHLADERLITRNSKEEEKEGKMIIDVLSLLEKYASTHLSVIELLKIVTVNHKILHSFAVNNDVNGMNYRDYYCKMFYSWFLPECSVTKPITI